MKTGKSKRMQQQSNSQGLLFIGGPSDALPGIARAKALGYRVFITDGNPESPSLKWAKRYADGWGVADIYDFAETIKVAKQWKFDGCLSIGCDIGPCISLVSKHFSLPHVSYHIAKLSWDKPALKKVLSQAGINVPRTADFVTKPVDGRGSRGVSIVSASNLWGAEWEAAKKNSPTGQVMCEEYICGPQVSSESIVYKGQAYTYLTDRDYSRGIVEAGGWSPSKFEGTPKGQEIKDTIQDAVLALRITNGTAKGDLVLNEANCLKPTILELAIGRISGGLSASHHLFIGYGIDFIGAALALSCGDNPLPYLEVNRKPKFTRGIFEINGKPKSNKERGRFFIGIGQTKGEAENKASCWLERRNIV